MSQVKISKYVSLEYVKKYEALWLEGYYELYVINAFNKYFSNSRYLSFPKPLNIYQLLFNKKKTKSNIHKADINIFFTSKTYLNITCITCKTYLNMTCIVKIFFGEAA